MATCDVLLNGIGFDIICHFECQLHLCFIENHWYFSRLRLVMYSHRCACWWHMRSLGGSASVRSFITRFLYSINSGTVRLRLNVVCNVAIYTISSSHRQLALFTLCFWLGRLCMVVWSYLDCKRGAKFYPFVQNYEKRRRSNFYMFTPNYEKLRSKVAKISKFPKREKKGV